MLGHFLRLNAVSPSRRRSLVAMMLAHVAALMMLVFGGIVADDEPHRLAVGNLLIIAGIVEGALLIGWRLTQLPKSQAIEFVLVSALEPTRFLLYEAIVAIGRLMFVTLSGTPILLWLLARGDLTLADVGTLLALPLAWGLATGLGLTAWAYEPLEVRRWGERLVMCGVLVYLVVGVLVGENLPLWLRLFPPRFATWIIDVLRFVHEANPFGVIRNAMLDGTTPRAGLVLFGIGSGFLMAALSLWRATVRMLPHFHDLHYRPLVSTDRRPRPKIGDRPLAWWAVKRVGNYSGRINLYLAAGFSVAYAAYRLAGPYWPTWLGRHAFVLFDDLGGIPMLTTALVLLAAVPAAFQYGLWDHNAHDRCRRLELLLLTDLEGRAYWEAAFAAAWNRGRGYFALAAILWIVDAASGSVSIGATLLAASAGVVLWGLYFALGFWAFARGVQANSLGLVLTLVLPLATFVAYRLGFTGLAACLPPGSLFFADRFGLGWLIGPIAAGLTTLVVARLALARCDPSLRRWYDRHHGVKVVE
jgi:hypothetical protein